MVSELPSDKIGSIFFPISSWCESSKSDIAFFRDCWMDARFFCIVAFYQFLRKESDTLGEHPLPAAYINDRGIITLSINKRILNKKIDEGKQPHHTQGNQIIMCELLVRNIHDLLIDQHWS
jgi:hypothetical protein